MTYKTPSRYSKIVIIFVDKRLWNFRSYLSLKGEDVIQQWYEEADDGLQAKFDRRLQVLQQQQANDWSMPHFRRLTGDAKGLSEIRLPYKKIQYRPLGFFSGHMEFTLLMVAEEKGDRFKPVTAIDIALKRKLEVETDRNRSHDYEIE